MSRSIPVSTRSRSEFIDITATVDDVVKASKIKAGLCHIFVPHTTAAVMINENADPSVHSDILRWLDKHVPAGAGYAHSEGNADSHIKSALIGPEKTVPVENGELRLGSWQGIYFCEFDGPRPRKVIITVSER
ncbi:MAG: YjbQ family protein [Candidatus Omnitrophica bacterium]|nr:YjbQ family protein [Candidatus Omnitrophota bacterium]